ncbi:MAG: helix-turn-helix domain-containing protein [Clostridium sp.]|nr:helix-turn-helix domain-containing protein [Clostridium sp.]
MLKDYNDIISIEDLCTILSIGYNTAYQLLSSGEIKAFKIGRIWKIPRVAVEEYIFSKSNLPACH